MKFNDRLNALMQVFAVSNSRLAAAMRVDASLISRWRSGERLVNADSPHITALARYFLKSANMDYQKHALSEVTGLDLNGKPVDIKSGMLACWLGGGLKDENTINASIEAFLTGIGSLGTPQRPAAQSRPQAEGGSPMGHQTGVEVFFGIQGRRDAVVKILCMVLAAPDPCELLLISEEDMSWLTGDRLFYARWASLLMQVVLKGCRIKIIHNVNRNTPEIISVMNKWLPLHLSGRIKSYYYPRYRDSSFKRTMFVATGVAAVTATTVGRTVDSTSNFFFYDGYVIDSIERDFRLYLRECIPLLKLFSAQNIDEYAAISAEFEGQGGDCVCYKEGPTSLTMPEGLYKRLIEGADINQEQKAELLQRHRSRTAAFINSLRYNVCTEVIKLPSADELMDRQSFIFSAAKGAPDQLLIYDREALTEHLQNVAYLINNYDNYHFVAVREPIIQAGGNITIAVKSATGAIVSTCANDGGDFVAIATNEPNITDAFYNYLIDILDGSPAKQRENEKVAVTLAEYIQKIKKLR